MKRILCATLCLLLLFCAACSAQPSTPEVPEPAPEIEAVPEPVIQPEEQTPPDNPSDPDRLPVYLYSPESGTDAAVDAHGQVLVQGDAGSLSLLRDSTTGETVYIQQLLSDENGQAESCRLYDLQGSIIAELPGFYAGISGDLLTRFDNATKRYTVQRISDSGIVVQDAYMVWLLGDVVVTKEPNWEAPSTVYAADGTILWSMPDGWYATGYYRDGDRYYISATDDAGRTGLMDAYGQTILPFQYSKIGPITNGRAAVHTEDTWAVVDLATGETAIQWPYAILSLYPEFAVVQSGEEYGRLILLDYSGNQLSERIFQWIDTIDDDFDGTPELVFGSLDFSRDTLPEGITVLQQTTVFLRPDGTEVFCAEYTEDSLMPLSSSVLLRRIKNPPSDGPNCYLVNMPDGSYFPLNGRNYQAGEPLWYYTSDPQPQDRQFFAASYEVAPEELRVCVMDAAGNVLLDELDAAAYLGGGVFRAVQAGTAGLLDISGQWLYVAE